MLQTITKVGLPDGSLLVNRRHRPFLPNEILEFVLCAVLTQCCRPDAVWHYEKTGRTTLKISKFISKLSGYIDTLTLSPRFTPFGFNAPCQFTPALTLRSLIFGLTPFGWQHPDTLTPYFWQEYHFSFTPLLFTPTNFRNAAKG